MTAKKTASSPRSAGYSDLGSILLSPTRALYSRSISCLAAAICRRSNSVTLTERHRSAARIVAPNISFKTARSHRRWGKSSVRGRRDAILDRSHRAKRGPTLLMLLGVALRFFQRYVPLWKHTGTKTYPTTSLLAKPPPRNVNHGDDRFSIFNKERDISAFRDATPR